jgi:hypothetical protein
MQTDYVIGSKKIRVQFSNDLVSEKLAEELSLYTQTNHGEKYDFIISVNQSHPDEILSKNPSVHITLKHGFIAQFQGYSVSWQKQNGMIHINLKYNAGKNFSKKVRNIQNYHPYEHVGQIFHEGVLVPSLLLFSDDVAAVHASAVANDEGCLCFGGTGGVGKTSLLLSAVLKNNYKFYSDDIAFIDTKGMLWPNFAYPKIYAYNTIGQPDLLKKIFSVNGPIDRLQWEYKKRLRGNTKARRRVSPKIFFGETSSDPVKATDFLFLFRKNQNIYSVESIKSEKIQSMNLQVILSEYADLFRHVHWHETNSLVLDEEPIVSMEAFRKSYCLRLKKGLNETKMSVFNIPFNEGLVDFKKLLTLIENR